MATRPRDADTKSTAAAEPAAAATLVSGRTPEQLKAMAAASIGAQIILDYNSDASIAARGGAGGTIEENTLVRDADLITVGLDPNAPSGPPTGVPWEPPPPPDARAAPPPARATRMSSLAAGIITSADDLPTPPPEGNGGGASAPANTTVPMVSQSGATLSATMGIWEHEPTAYVYEWTVGGTVYPATDAATYAVQPADVGTAATCVVTASNAEGSTAAPPSNEITVSDSAAASRSKK